MRDRRERNIHFDRKIDQGLLTVLVYCSLGHKVDLSAIASAYQLPFWYLFGHARLAAHEFNTQQPWIC